MKRYDKLPIILLAASALTALVSIIVRILLTLTALDTKYGVYERGNPLPDIYHIILALACVALALLALVRSPARERSYMIPRSDLTVFASCAAAFLLIFELFLTAYYILIVGEDYTAFDILELAFSIPAIVFFLGLAIPKQKSPQILAFTSFFPIAWCAVCLIRTYFDNTQLMTSPNKIIGELAMLSAMIYFLNESRNQLGITSHRFYLASSTVAPVLLLTSAVPNLLLADKLSIAASDNYMRYAIDAVLALFILTRLGAYARRPDTAPSNQVESN